jgi:predicted negative regulator of RcsB-dependent stress response
MPSATRPADPTPSTDPLLETEVFWAKYKTPILIGIIAILLGAAAVAAFWLYKQQRDSAAAIALSQAKDEAAYQKVINEHGGSAAAASAYIFLANDQRKKQNFAGSNETLQKFISKYPKHELVTTAKMAVGANLESLNKPDEALETYRRIAADYPKSFNAPLAMLAQVPLLKAKGQVDQARQVCETVLTQFRDSAAAQMASQYLRTLKPATPPAGVTPAPESPAASAAPTP